MRLQYRLHSSRAEKLTHFSPYSPVISHTVLSPAIARCFLEAVKIEVWRVGGGVGAICPERELEELKDVNKAEEQAGPS